MLTILNFIQPNSHYYILQSRQAMEEWVSGLREAKEFWIQRQKGKEFALPVSLHNEADKLQVVSTPELMISQGAGEGGVNKPLKY